MKKRYFEPKTEILELEAFNIMISVSVSDEETDDDAKMVGNHQDYGGWGDIWGDK